MLIRFLVWLLMPIVHWTARQQMKLIDEIHTVKFGEVILGIPRLKNEKLEVYKKRLIKALQTPPKTTDSNGPHK